MATEAAPSAPLRSREFFIAAFTLLAIAAHLAMRVAGAPRAAIPLYAALLIGGMPLLIPILAHILHGQFETDVLAGLSIVTSAFTGEYLAGATIVLMLAGGEALEAFALRRASAVLEALARRAPSIAHRVSAEGLKDAPLDEIAIGELLVILPHELAPVDGVVVDGHGTMDESYLTGEPFEIHKAPGSGVFSGAVNGAGALTIRATRRAVDSRYARIVEVMHAAGERRPRLRRVADRMGAWYTPLGIATAALAWISSGDSHRFLAVLVIATPCPLLLAIPVAILGAISACARRGIVIRNPAAIEQLDRCRTMIFDKTGTLTYGRPSLTEIVAAPGVDREEALAIAASLEAYSKHPLAAAVIGAARRAGLAMRPVERVEENPGHGLRGEVGGHPVELIGRKIAIEHGRLDSPLPEEEQGLECLVFLDGRYAALLRFRDEPREEGEPFIRHLAPRHRVSRIMLVSGDRESEVHSLARKTGIAEVRWEKSPEDKVEIVREETSRAPTIFIGDGINDAPAMMAATAGIAFGMNSDITAEAADAVVLEPTLNKIDELIHIARRTRRIAIESAAGGMALSSIGMVFAAAGFLAPVTGAVLQELIDLAAVLNALRAGLNGRVLTDF